MQHRIETKVGPDGRIVLHHLPFREGETVEVVVTPTPAKEHEINKYPLRGKPVVYDRPFDALDDQPEVQ